MTDVLTQAPDGAVLTDPATVAAALSNLQATTAEQPLRYAGGAPAANDAAHPGASAEELKPLDEKPVVPQPAQLQFPDPRPGGAPVWAVLPPDLTFPRGRVVFFLRFRSTLTNTPNKGLPSDGELTTDGKPVLYRQAIVWAMSVGDKKFAAGRSMGDALRFSEELVKSCLRAVDGRLVDLSDSSLDVWWDEVGEKVRGLLQRTYSQLHNLKAEELDYFLEHCVEARSAV